MEPDPFAPPDASPSFAGLLGYRRRRRWPFGMQARFVELRDGLLVVRDRRGGLCEQVPVHGMRCRLQRGVVRVRSEGREFFLFGWGPPNVTPPELAAQVIDSAADVLVLPAVVSGFTGSRATFDALLAAGALPG